MPIIIGGGSANGISSFSGGATFQGALSSTGTLSAPAVSTGGTLGTQGQILASTGSASTWVNGWTLINTITGTSAAALQDTTSLTSTYSNYMIYIRNLTPATNGVTLYLQVYSGGSYIGSNYSPWIGAGYVAASGAAASSSLMFISRPSYMSNSYPLTGTIFVSSPSSTTSYKTFQGTVGYYDTNWTGTVNAGVASIWTGGTGAITGFQIAASSGNVTGTIQVYGSN